MNAALTRRTLVGEEVEQVPQRDLDAPDRLLLGQEIERSRIARDLHDGLGQRLALLSMNLRNIVHHSHEAPPVLRDRLNAVCSEVERLSKDLHCIAHNLHPTALAHTGLADAIRQLCADVSMQMRIEVEFVSDGSVPSVSEDAALALYRITQEALSNVARHSHSTSATVSLLHEGALQLTITDAGVGFDPTRLHSTDGLGLTNIRERASMLGGTLEVRSVPSQGTTITLRVPVPDSDAFIACAGQPRPRVLLCDDHFELMTALVRLLTLSCNVVGCVTDGAALLEAIASRHPDVVVLDVNLPSMNGLEACRKIGQAVHARTVMLTAHDDATLRDAALAAGAAAFVVKSRIGSDLLPAILTAAAQTRRSLH